MGVDFLDTMLEIEKTLGVELSTDDIRQLGETRSGEDRWDLTAADLHDLVCLKLTQAGRDVPRSSWHRIQISLARALGESPKNIEPDTWLVSHLGMH